MSITRFGVVVCLAAAMVAPAGAQLPPRSEPSPYTRDGARIVSAEAARADLDALYAGLKEAHFDLFAQTSSAVFDQHHAEMRAALDQPMSTLELLIRFQQFVALARHGHARIEFPIADYVGYREAGGARLPFGAAIRNGAILLTDPLHAGLARGDRLLEINGEPAALFLNRLSRHVSAETPRLSHTLVERFLPGLFWLEYGAPERIRLRLRRGDEEVEIDIDPSAPSAPVANAETPFTLDGRDARMIGADIAYLRPGAFYNTADAENPWDTTGHLAFIDAAFETFITAGAGDLIIDLRDNPGGDNSFSDPIIAWFADQPFRFYSSFRVRVSEQTTASNQARLDAGGGGVSLRYAELFATAGPGEVVEMDFGDVPPRDGARFQGAVHVLVNRYSYSNAVTTAALIQDYGFGRIYGETTADMATTYGALEYFTLPETGIRVAYPKAHIVRPNGDARPHPVTPDVMLDFPPTRGGEDEVLGQLIELIRAAR